MGLSGLDGRGRKQGYALLVASVMIAGLSIASAIGAWAPHLEPIPFEYEVLTEPSYTLCPGQFLEYQVHLVMRDTPTLIQTARAWQTLDGRNLHVYDEPPIPYSDPTEFTGEVRLLVPSLAPGEYLVAVAAAGWGTVPIGYHIHVEIPADCGVKP